MFKCYCQCFKKNYEINGAPYISILNETHVKIFFIIQYSIGVRTFTKESHIFGHGKSDRINFSYSAYNLCFNVLNASTSPYGFIGNVCVPCAMPHCYKLIENQGRFEIILTSCYRF
ncbi:hypothetical protein G8S55_07350 [Clostridium botulinum C]|uniref:hypothetical protein n=1 Tax=Clostridium TaxID=1485 RepID=UPI000EA15244|nr:MULTISPECIES: hypothetical protein [Clostridium]AYF54448.1 hypothetical protein DFH04_06910 [Clostridium novyi]MCD3217068.1 hypothetical protein [Clostridium botulinum C]